jgi:RHS repeat-associated protein
MESDPIGQKVIKADNSYDIKRYIAGVAIWTHKFNSAGAQTTLDKRYTYKDVLGSTVLITDAIGGIKGQMAFDEWGKRVSYNDWTTDHSSVYAGLQVSQLFTTQGYTGHDMLDAVGLIHMQGRIYDARLGRFVQADPIVQDATDLQAYNRYSYVRNNPLTLTDPSGFSWLSKTWKKIKKNWRVIAAVVIAVVAPYALPLIGISSPIAIGAIAGGLAGYVTTGSLEGALLGAVSGAAFGALHGWSPNGGLWSAGGLGKVAAHGFVGGVTSVMQGGKFGHGFLSAGVSQAMSLGGGYEAMGVTDSPSQLMDYAKNAVAAAAVGGTVSQLTGGKFGNGAVTAAFSRMLNDLACSKNAGLCTGNHPTKKELDAHYNDGTGYPVLAGTMDASWLDSSQFDAIPMGGSGSIYTDWPTEIAKDLLTPFRAVGDRNIYGSFTATRIGETNTFIATDNYGFEMHSITEPVRNAATAYGFGKATGGNPVNMYKSKPFDIYVVGPISPGGKSAR